jgi:inositol-hexakisphosphate/diphosphoinositol-pentakisphosphate 1-kinase
MAENSPQKTVELQIPEHSPEQSAETEETSLNKIVSSTSSSGSAKVALSSRASNRSSSHTLLSANNASSTLRKGMQASTEHTEATMDRPSISMPPSSSKAADERRISVSAKLPRHSEDNMASMGEYPIRSLPAALADSSSNNGNVMSDSRRMSSTGGRFSLASLHPVATAMLAPTANEFSIASSSNDSVKSNPVDEPQSPRKSPSSQAMGPPTTATDRTPVTISSIAPTANGTVMSPPALSPNEPPRNANSSSKHAGNTNNLAPNKDGAFPLRAPRPTRSVSATRRFSGSTGTSAAGSESDGTCVYASPTTSADAVAAKVPLVGKIGVCALDVKARSRPSRSILTRLQGQGEFEVIVFGDKVILDEGMDELLLWLSELIGILQTLRTGLFGKPS